MRCFTLKISVLMTTFNGQTYIYEQLLSIYEQTVSPNEVIICDDCSTDETASIIHHFINEHSLKNWHLIVNPQNKGWQRNFIETLSKVSGSYIFSAIRTTFGTKRKWKPWFILWKNNPEIQCLSGKMTTIDANGLSFKGNNIFSTDRFSGTLNKLPFSACFNTSILQGCTMCITKKTGRPYPEDEYKRLRSWRTMLPAWNPSGWNFYFRWTGHALSPAWAEYEWCKIRY